MWWWWHPIQRPCMPTSLAKMDAAAGGRGFNGGGVAMAMRMEVGRASGWRHATALPFAPRLLLPEMALTAEKTKKTSTATKKMIVETNEEYIERMQEDEEWQRERRQESEDLNRLRWLEEEEEKQKVEIYRKINMQSSGTDDEELRRARRLVAMLLRSGEEIEEKIEEIADNGELTDLILLVIQKRLELARHDDEIHAIQALDLLHRRVQAEMMKRSSTPALHFLNEMLNLYDGFNYAEWIKSCRQRMLKTFPVEDALTILAPPGINLSSQHGPIEVPEEDVLLRVDFIREVDALIEEIKDYPKTSVPIGRDPQSVALCLEQQQREKTIQQIVDLRSLAVTLKW